MNWSPSDALVAVRSLLSMSTPRSWAYERADLNGDQLLVVFRVDAAALVPLGHDPGTRFGVHYSVADLPEGPSTGTAYDTPEEWAEEIGWDLDEQVDTGGVGRAERTPGPDGVVLLRWR